MTTKKKVLALLFALSLQACVSGAKYTPMTSKTQNAIDSLDNYHLVIQDEIKPDISLMNASGALGGGLIGAMIDSSVNDDRASEARDGILSLYTEIVDVDYRRLIAKALNDSLGQQFTLVNVKDSAQAVILSDKEIEKRVKTLAAGEALAFTNHFYQFRNESKILQTISAVFIFLPNQKPSASKPDYFNVFYYHSPFSGSGKNSSNELWAQNEGKLFKDVIQQSVELTAQAIKYDMQVNLNESCVRGGKASIANDLGVQSISGMVIQEEDERVMFRSNEGHLYLLNSSEVENKKNKACAQGDQS